MGSRKRQYAHVPCAGPYRLFQLSAASVFDEEAGVLDDQKTSRVRFGGSFGVGNSLLEPEGFGVDRDGGIGDRGNVLWAAEDVDDIDGKWNVFEAGVGFFAQDFGFVGIDGDDFVAGALEVGRDFMRRSTRIGRETDDGDGFRGAEEIKDWVVGRGKLVGYV